MLISKYIILQNLNLTGHLEKNFRFCCNESMKHPVSCGLDFFSYLRWNGNKVKEKIDFSTILQFCNNRLFNYSTSANFKKVFVNLFVSKT